MASPPLPPRSGIRAGGAGRWCWCCAWCWASTCSTLGSEPLEGLLPACSCQVAAGRATLLRLRASGAGLGGCGMGEADLRPAPTGGALILAARLGTGWRGLAGLLAGSAGSEDWAASGWDAGRRCDPVRPWSPEPGAWRPAAAAPAPMPGSGPLPPDAGPARRGSRPLLLFCDELDIEDRPSRDTDCRVAASTCCAASACCSTLLCTRGRATAFTDSRGPSGTGAAGCCWYACCCCWKWWLMGCSCCAASAAAQGDTHLLLPTTASCSSCSDAPAASAEESTCCTGWGAGGVGLPACCWR
mmetsp:Transcript_11814/g.28961  ORF Transcript_11814/g.28961 Transcript_11814/m.28961 type:complete len:300 (+) Transcript_11814:193-1092(+)